MSLGLNAGEAAAVSDVKRTGPIEVLVGADHSAVFLARFVGLWALGLALVAFVGVTIPHPPIPGLNVTIVRVGSVLLLAAAVPLVMRPSWFPPNALRALLLVSCPGMVIGTVWSLGPRVEVGVAPLALAGAFSPTWFGRRWAALYIVVLAISYGIVLGTQSGYPGPANRWFVVIGATVGAAALYEWVAGLIRNLATLERATHRELEATHAELQQVHQELADLNQTLEERVTAQLDEIEGLNRLRRFLSPQVAEAVLTAGDEALLRPHRRQIAVFFCDLRGFTSFAAGAEPEEVLEALDHYYKVVGEVLRRHDATVGTFAGDGIMAYLNDPVPCDDPAGTAVRMAQELRTPMAALLSVWDRRGFDLGYGIGIAYGHATLGIIGFEGRHDYTALGSVVNLAARLCGEAATGQVLVDPRTADALGSRYLLAEREVLLKGFPAPIRAHEVVGLAAG